MVFLKYWSCSHDFNKLVIIHILSFLGCIKIQYDFLALRDLVVYIKTKIIYYDIKIQTDINQNDVEKHAGKSLISQNDFKIFFLQGRASLKGDWAEISPKMKSGLLSARAQ